MAGYLLAVDLGTTKTAAAILRDGRVSVVALGQRDASIPTVLVVEADGSVVVGEAAQRRALDAPERVVREVKRRVGDDAPVLVAGTPWAAELLLARVLRHVVDRVTEEQAGPPDVVVLTHPANWGRYKLDLVVQAARQVGVDRVELIAEPVAAAAWYAADHRVPDGAVVAVYDLGGGTFDAAVVRRTGDRFELLGVPDGVERFGGVDIDAAVLGTVTEQLGTAWTSLDATDPEVLTDVIDLRARCVEAKEALSVDTTATIPVRLPTVRTTVRLTRDELESMVRAPLGETIVALQRTIASAGMTPSDLHAVLLVGGASRMPVVGELVTSTLGVPVAVDVNPKLAVASGAAALAGTTAASPPPPAEPVVPPAWAATPNSATPEPAVPEPAVPGRRRRWVPVAVALGVVAAVVAGVLALAGGGGDDDDDDVATGGGPSTTATTEAPAVAGDVPEGDGVLRVGVLVPTTESGLDFLSPAMESAVGLAAEDLNEAGGVLGSEVEVEVSEDVDVLVERGVDVVIGPVDLTDSDAIDTVRDEGLAGCTAHEGRLTALTDDGGRYVRTIPAQGIGVAAIGQVLADDGHTHVGVVTADDQPEYRDAMLASLDDLGITADVVVDVDVADFDPGEVVAELNDSATTAAVLLGSAELSALVIEGAGAGYLIFYGDESLESDDVGRRIADVVEGGAQLQAVSVQPAPEGYVSDEVEARIGEFPFAAPYLYDCVLLAALSAATGGSDHPDAIVDRWVELSRDGEQCFSTDCLAFVTGDDDVDLDLDGETGVDLDDDGEVQGGTYDVWRWLPDASKEHVRVVEL